MLRREMISMMMGSTPMNMMQLTLPFFMMIDYMEECTWIVDYGHLICPMCYFFPLLDDELMSRFENFVYLIIFSYFYCVYGVYLV
ncbi:hypothetical protein AMTRI_Chr05g72530 [Amborella trichopoda]